METKEEAVQRCFESFVRATFIPYTVLGSTLAIHGGLNMKSPRAHVFQHLVPAGDTVWEGHRTLQRWNLAEGSRSLGVSLEAI